MVILVLGVLAWIAVLVHLNNKDQIGKKGLQMMEDNNLILKQYMEQIEANK